MSKEEKTLLHRVKLYVGKTLVNVVPDLLEEPAKALMEEWLDIDLDRHAECDTLKCGCDDDREEPEQSDSFATPYDVYSVENTLGIINVVAKNEQAARDYVQGILDASGERTGSTLTVDNVIKTIDVHIVMDDMGVVMNQLTAPGLDEAANRPFEDA